MENKDKNKQCKIHVMPGSISEADLSALFNGLISLVKKKTEIDNQEKFIILNDNVCKLKKQLKEKTNECNRLKNEIIYLKSQLNNQQ